MRVWKQELKHRDTTARWRAAAVFAIVRPPVQEAVPDLIGCLRDSAFSVREQAAVSLGQMGPCAREAVPALNRLLHDPVQRVRDAAAEALKKIEASAEAKEEGR
jgi:HEAT repeat protein